MVNMEEAFVIMQIGNPQLDMMWKDVYHPVIKDCGLEPKRVDKHNEGRLLQSEIADFVNRGKIIIADLTNERQNCYLEVGYAMGIGKFKNLILCAREDHHHESKNHVKGRPKIHFDLSGYGFIWWDEQEIDKFKEELSMKIKQRLNLLKGDVSSSEGHQKEDVWLQERRRETSVELTKLILTGFYEVNFHLCQNLPNKSHPELLKIAERAMVRNSGWPIGAVSYNEYKPKQELDGIKAIISTEDMFDYWFLKKDGRFYFLRNYEEEIIKVNKNMPGKIIRLGTRIRSISEAIMYCYKLYKEFNINEQNKIDISILYGGLKEWVLDASEPSGIVPIPNYKKCSVNEVRSNTVERLTDLMPNIKDIVFKLASELFAMFDYFELHKNVSDDIVNKFISGKF